MNNLSDQIIARFLEEATRQNVDINDQIEFVAQKAGLDKFLAHRDIRGLSRQQKASFIARKLGVQEDFASFIVGRLSKGEKLDSTIIAFAQGGASRDVPVGKLAGFAAQKTGLSVAECERQIRLARAPRVLAMDRSMMDLSVKELAAFAHEMIGQDMNQLIGCIQEGRNAAKFLMDMDNVHQQAEQRVKQEEEARNKVVNVARRLAQDPNLYNISNDKLVEFVARKAGNANLDRVLSAVAASRAAVNLARDPKLADMDVNKVAQFIAQKTDMDSSAALNCVRQARSYDKIRKMARDMRVATASDDELAGFCQKNLQAEGVKCYAHNQIVELISDFRIPLRFACNQKLTVFDADKIVAQIRNRTDCSLAEARQMVKYGRAKVDARALARSKIASTSSDEEVAQLVHAEYKQFGCSIEDALDLVRRARGRASADIKKAMAIFANDPSLKDLHIKDHAEFVAKKIPNVNAWEAAHMLLASRNGGRFTGFFNNFEDPKVYYNAE